MQKDIQYSSFIDIIKKTNMFFLDILFIVVREYISRIHGISAVKFASAVKKDVDRVIKHRKGHNLFVCSLGRVPDMTSFDTTSFFPV